MLYAKLLDAFVIVVFDPPTYAAMIVFVRPAATFVLNTCLQDED